MTRGSARTTSGRALGDLLAVVEHRDPVADAHHDPHVVLDQQDRDPEVAADPADQVGHLARLDGVHPGRRLVEQEQPGVAGERAGDLEPSLIAVREVASRLLVAALEPHVARATRGPCRWRPPPRGCASAAGTPRRSAWHPCGCACPPARSRGRTCSRTAGCSGTSGRSRSATISLGRALRKIPARCRRCDVPRRPDDRDDERGDQEPDRHQHEQLAADLEASRDGDGGEDAEHERKREPEERLGPGPAGTRDDRLPGERDRAFARLEQAGDDVEEGRLAGPVGADEAHDGALGDVEVDGSHRDEAAEPLRDPARIEQQAAARWRGRGRRGRRIDGGRGAPSRARLIGGVTLQARCGPSDPRRSARPRLASRGARVACAGSGTGPRV